MKRIKGWREVTVGALTIALTGYLACVDERDVDPDIDTLRDSLALDPRWIAGLPDDERGRMESRFEAEVEAQAQAGAWSALEDDVVVTSPMPPRESISRLDDARAANDEEPLLIAIHTRGEDGRPSGVACDLTEDDLEPTVTDRQFDAWIIEDGFDRELAMGESEREALEARLPLLAQWLKRCADGDAFETRQLTFRRAAGAPALVSFWPQAKRVYVNPVLLLLWSPPPPLRTMGQGLTSWPLSACVSELLDHCERSANAPDGVSCDDARVRPSAWCVGLLSRTEGQSLRTCVRQRSGYDPDCELPAGDDPLFLYDEFVDNQGCLAALDACMARDEPEYRPGEPVPHDHHYEDDSSTVSDCAAECFTELGPECASAACDGCGDSGSSGGGCEGDSLGGAACSGCEGDTF